MKIDLYTKSVLTVIAVSLVVLAIQDIVPNAVASSSIQKVMICDQSGVCAGIVEMADLTIPPALVTYAQD